MNEDKDVLAMVEQFLDEMIQAGRADRPDYELFTKRFDKQILKDFTPSKFQKRLPVHLRRTGALSMPRIYGVIEYDCYGQAYTLH